MNKKGISKRLKAPWLTNTLSTYTNTKRGCKERVHKICSVVQPFAAQLLTWVSPVIEILWLCVLAVFFLNFFFNRSNFWTPYNNSLVVVKESPGATGWEPRHLCLKRMSSALLEEEKTCTHSWLDNYFM